VPRLSFRNPGTLTGIDASFAVPISSESVTVSEHVLHEGTLSIMAVSRRTIGFDAATADPPSPAHAAVAAVATTKHANRLNIFMRHNGGP